MDFLSHIAKKLTAVLLSLSLIVGLALTSAAAPNANNGNGRPKYNTTQVIVKYKDPSQSAATDQRVRGNVGHIKNIKSLSNNGNHNGATQGNSPGNGNLATLASLSLVQTDSVDNMDAVMNAYDTDPNVLYAAPNYQMSLFEADPLFDQQ
ncbi:MAG: hypothetical protein FWF49_04245, partial [Oscillospiraceae bacterium]|nr:hypothetical protein [Oscillospiraceae bacterium]